MTDNNLWQVQVMFIAVCIFSDNTGSRMIWYMQQMQ